MFKRTLAVRSVQVVDVGVSQGATSDSVSADSDTTGATGIVQGGSFRVRMKREEQHGQRQLISNTKDLDSPRNRSNHVEDLEKHGLGDCVLQLSNIKTSTRPSGGSLIGSRSRSWLRSRSLCWRSIAVHLRSRSGRSGGSGSSHGFGHLVLGVVEDKELSIGLVESRCSLGSST